MLKQAIVCDHEDEALVLTKAAKNEIKSLDGLHLFFLTDGTFPSGCQQQSVPTIFQTRVSMMLNGADLKDQEFAESQTSLTISRTILFNYEEHATTSAKSRYSLERDIPLPVIIGMKIHTERRSTKLMKRLFDLGLSVNYGRILQLEAICQLLCLRVSRAKGL